MYPCRPHVQCKNVELVSNKATYIYHIIPPALQIAFWTLDICSKHAFERCNHAKVNQATCLWTSASHLPSREFSPAGCFSYPNCWGNFGVEPFFCREALRRWTDRLGGNYPAKKAGTTVSLGGKKKQNKQILLAYVSSLILFVANFTND